MKSLKWPYVLLLVLPVAFVSFWLGRSSSVTSGQRERLAQLQQENQDLKSAMEKLRSLNTALEAQTRAAANPEGEKPAQATPSKRELSYIEDIGTVAALRDSLALANKTIDELRARASDQQAQFEQLRQEHNRLTALEADLNNQLSSVKKAVEMKDTELAQKSEDLRRAENANKQMREDASAARAKSNRLLQTAGELQEVYRRRESYLNTLLSRYREITEQYRAFISVLENRRGPEGTPGSTMSVAGPELSRIQASIALAEEDLRQLNTLNAQALRLQKRLAGN